MKEENNYFIDKARAFAEHGSMIMRQTKFIEIL